MIPFILALYRYLFIKHRCIFRLELLDLAASLLVNVCTLRLVGEIPPPPSEVEVDDLQTINLS